MSASGPVEHAWRQRCGPTGGWDRAFLRRRHALLRQGYELLTKSWPAPGDDVQQGVLTATIGLS